MRLADALVNRTYIIRGMDLPLKTTKRLEALGMIRETSISIIYRRPSAMVIILRGTRFAIGKTITQNITVEEVNP